MRQQRLFRSGRETILINYRVANLDRMIEQLRQKGVTVEPVQQFEYGRFAWIVDPEGNRLELWEPPDQ